MGNFWDDIKDGAGRFAKKAIDKTTNAVDITKLNLAKSDTEGKIGKLYTKLGEDIYNQYKDGAEFDGEVSEILAEIERFDAELDEIKEQISALKTTITCPKCGTQNAKDCSFCAKCGSKLITEEAPGEESEEESATVDIAE